MRFHNLSDHLVLAGQLRLKETDFSLQAAAPRVLETVTAFLERRRPILEKLLLPAIEDVRVQPEFVTDVGNRLLFDQMQV